MKNKLYLATAIVNFMVCGSSIACGHYVLAPFWAAVGGFWVYVWSRKD